MQHRQKMTHKVLWAILVRYDVVIGDDKRPLDIQFADEISPPKRVWSSILVELDNFYFRYHGVVISQKGLVRGIVVDNVDVGVSGAGQPRDLLLEISQMIVAGDENWRIERAVYCC